MLNTHIPVDTLITEKIRQYTAEQGGGYFLVLPIPSPATHTQFCERICPPSDWRYNTVSDHSTPGSLKTG